MMRKVLVLDDDPTGSQAVSGVPIYPHPTQEDLMRPEPVQFLLTNSRALPAREAVRVAENLGEMICGASNKSGIDFRIVSRSDSTLRGHFPDELLGLMRTCGQTFDGIVLCPVFTGGGRVTVDGIHYLRSDGSRVPVCESEFAQDRVFGYHSLRLDDWVREKWGASAPPTVSLSLEDIRDGNLLHLLENAVTGAVIIPSAESGEDLEKFAIAIRSLEARGRRYLYRTAADWIGVYASLPPSRVLQFNELQDGEGHGVLVVVGSYVANTGRQLDYMRRFAPGSFLELNLQSDPNQLALLASKTLARDELTVLFTSRDPSLAGDLAVGKRYGDMLVDLVRALSVRPGVVIAKGGNTSYDLAARALGVLRAEVLGQVLPGVSVWQCGPEALWPQLKYVVFPGNVGKEPNLFELVEGLAKVKESGYRAR